MNIDGTKGTKQAKQLKNRTNSLVSTEDTYIHAAAHGTLCTTMTPSWLQVVVGITEEWMRKGSAWGATEREALLLLRCS